jgi:fido (protein-threonine AMPylation protein)
VVPESLSDLEKFLHVQNGLPLLIQIGLAHAQFETIHPFLDGNGEVVRLCGTEWRSDCVLFAVPHNPIRRNDNRISESRQLKCSIS